MIKPVQGRILVKLKGQYENLEGTDERFGTSRTRGIVLDVAESVKVIAKRLGIEPGKYVYFGKYEDTAPYGTDGSVILIKLEEVGGVGDGKDDDYEDA